MAGAVREVWFVWVPGEDAPHMHLSRDKAKAQADMVARMHVGTTIDLFKLTSVGSIKYPSSPTISGEMC